MKHYTTITIHDWMISELGLKDMAIVVYAYLYQFHKDSIKCENTLDEIADELNITRQGLGKILRKLTMEQLVQKERKGVKSTYFLNPLQIPLGM